MPVSDIQIWADNLEDSRLPGIESDIQANTTEINNRVAELSYLIDVNAANTSSVYNTVTSVDALATGTYNQFVNLEVTLKAYADASAQAIRNDFQLTLDGNNQAWQASVEANLQASYDATLVSNAAQNDADYALASTLMTDIQSYSDSYATSLDALLNVEVPSLQADIATAQGDATTVLDAFNQFMTNYDYATLTAGLDNIRAENEEKLAPLGKSTLRVPATAWGKDIETATGLFRPTLGIYGTFVTDDVDMGECFEFGDTSQASIGSAYPVKFTPGSVYKVTARVKVASGTSTVAVGIVASQGGTDTFTAELLFAPDPLGTVDGVVERSIYVSTDDTAMANYGIIAADRITITGSDAATKLYTYVQQNAGGLTTGLLRVGEIEVLNVTEVLNGVQMSETRLSASQGSNTANINDILALGVTNEHAFGTMLTELSVDANGTIAGISNFGTAMADVYGNAAASYAFRVQAGSSGALLELIAADDPNGPVSLARIEATDIILEGTVTTQMLSADVLVADNITAGKMSVARIDLDELLSIDVESAGFAMGKISPFDNADGIYMGRTGDSGGFGFAMSRRGTRLESIAATSQNGLEIRNAKFFQDLAPAPTEYDVITTSTVDLTGSTSFGMQYIGGGGGGGGSNTVNGNPGTVTTIVLKDASNVTHATWTAAGGAGGIAGAGSGGYGNPGTSTPWGSGGSGGLPFRSVYECTGAGKGEECTTVYYNATNGGHATGFGAGGGGAGDGAGGGGGGAGPYQEVPTFDVTGITDPRLEITIGSAGTGGYEGSGKTGGTGSQGRVYITASNAALPARADVIPIEATATGSFVNTPGNVFPDLGAGMWVLTTGTTQTMNTGFEMDDTGQILRSWYDSVVTFVSTKTPLVSGRDQTRTIYYKFYKMGD